MANSQMVITKQPKHAKRTAFGNRETATVIESASAAGEICPLYVVFKGAKHFANWYNVSDLHPSTRISVSSSGYNNDRIQLDWIDFFQRHSEKYQVGDYRLLLLDGFGSHHTKEFVGKCKEYNIIPFVFPSHLTHLLQPLDVGVFQPLKHEYSKLLLAAHRDGFTDRVKETFLSNVTQARKKALRSQVVKSAFKKSGIVPLNPLVVLSKLPARSPSLERPSTPPSHDAHVSPHSPFSTPQTNRQFTLLFNKMRDEMNDMEVTPSFLDIFAQVEKGPSTQPSTPVRLSMISGRGKRPKFDVTMKVWLITTI